MVILDYNERPLSVPQQVLNASERYGLSATFPAGPPDIPFISLEAYFSPNKAGSGVEPVNARSVQRRNAVWRWERHALYSSAQRCGEHHQPYFCA